MVNTLRFLNDGKNLDIIYDDQKIIVLSLIYAGFLNLKEKEQKTIMALKKYAYLMIISLIKLI